MWSTTWQETCDRSYTEDMTLFDAMRRCLHIGGDVSTAEPLLRQCPHRFAVIDTSGRASMSPPYAVWGRVTRQLLHPFARGHVSKH